MSNERTKEKKEWHRPELTVLVRNKPEEAVLSSCKTAIAAGPYGSFSHCVNMGPVVCSVVCSAAIGS